MDLSFLFASKPKILAEYALCSMNAPMGIPDIPLLKGLPKELKRSLRSAEEIEAELS